jgi:hypothetical protein
VAYFGQVPRGRSGESFVPSIFGALAATDVVLAMRAIDVVAVAVESPRRAIGIF